MEIFLPDFLEANISESQENLKNSFSDTTYTVMSVVLVVKWLNGL